jgi:hypothetical protein
LLSGEIIAVGDEILCLYPGSNFGLCLLIVDDSRSLPTPSSILASPSVHRFIMAADLGDAHRNPGASLLEDDFEFVDTPKAPQPANSTNFGVRTTSVCCVNTLFSASNLFEILIILYARSIRP